MDDKFFLLIRTMPIVTRSRSKQLKRDRNGMEKENQSIAPKIEKQPQKKKRKLNEEQKEESPPIKKKSKKKNKKIKKKEKESELQSDDAAAMKEMHRLKQHHRDLLQDGYQCVVGVDKAGR